MGAHRGTRTPSPRLPLFSLRLSDLTKSRWREAAEREGRTLAGYIKHATDSYRDLDAGHRESTARRLDALECPIQCSEGAGWDVRIGSELHYHWCPKAIAAALRGEIEWPS